MSKHKFPMTPEQAAYLTDAVEEFTDAQTLSDALICGMKSAFGHEAVVRLCKRTGKCSCFAVEYQGKAYIAVSDENVITFFSRTIPPSPAV